MLNNFNNPQQIISRKVKAPRNMETQLEAQNVIPEEQVYIKGENTYSFTETLKIIKSTERAEKALTLNGLFNLNKKEKKSLKRLPKAFRLNRTLQKLEFREFEMNDILVAEFFKAGIRTESVTCIIFSDCARESNETLMETMCEGLMERSMPFELKIYKCSGVFVKPIINAAYLKCFSLSIIDLNCSSIKRPMKKLFSKANLYYISLESVTELKEKDFLQLGRCLLPNLSILNLGHTLIPSSALKRIYGFLKVILDSGRSNAFEHLDLGATTIDNKLTFTYLRLLRFDIIGRFGLNVKGDVSRAVVKNICSTVAKTKNLKTLKTGRRISSETECEKLSLQNETNLFGKSWYDAPFDVIPPVV